MASEDKMPFVFFKVFCNIDINNYQYECYTKGNEVENYNIKNTKVNLQGG